MAEFPGAADILEQILLRLDVKDLLRCKSVCKSWLTLISHPCFIKTHLNYSYNDDLKKINEYGHRRVVIGTQPIGFDFRREDGPFPYLIGSSNGLVCNCYENAEIIVANPCTRAERKLPQIPGYTTSSYWPVCCGFGYDPSTDDFKVVAGLRKREYVTRFHMLTLKSNVWKVIGEVKYMFNTRAGILCNGALHWVMFPPHHNTGNQKAVILSFDLSQHNFKEIPQPDDDPLYQSLGVGVAQSRWEGKTDMALGIMRECRLSIFPIMSFPQPHIWVMNRYNVKESWQILGPHDWEAYRQPQHVLPHVDWSARRDKLFMHSIRMCMHCYDIATPVFVRSLVSPHAPFLLN